MLTKKLRLRKFISGVLFWLGIVLMGILAIPAAILFGINYLIGEAIDFILNKVGRN